MKLGLSTAAIAVLLLAGCDQMGNSAGNGSNMAASHTGGNAAASQPAGGNGLSDLGDGAGNSTAAGGASAMPLTRDYVVGSWSVTGNCTAPEFVFNADGSVSRGGQNYQWRVDGSNLVVSRVGQTESESTPVRVVDQRNMVVTSGEGPIPLRRC